MTTPADGTAGALPKARPIARSRPGWTELLAPLLTLLFAPSGCTSRVAPVDVGAGCPEEPARDELPNPDPLLIDDFERGDQLLPRLGGRDGAWIRGDDGTFTSLIAASSTACAARGAHAGHFAGREFTSWGANWTAVLQNNNGGTAAPYDASQYAGISFLAAIGSDVSAPLSVPVGVTTMDVAWNGGICQKCMDYYRTEVKLSHAWRQISVRFADLAQSGIGDPLVPLRRDQLVGFIVWPETDFDIWIDDVRFEPTL